MNSFIFVELPYLSGFSMKPDPDQEVISFFQFSAGARIIGEIKELN